MLRVEQLKKTFRLSTGWIRGIKEHPAVNEATFSLPEGRVLGLIGESGCGKSTLARCLLRLIPPSGGKIFFREWEITALPEKKLRALRPQMQIIFQDSVNTFSPRLTVNQMLREIACYHRLPELSPDERVRLALHQVGLPDETGDRYAHQLSGGQRQRLGIARALMTRPAFLIADEPVSALDPSIQAQILNLLKDLQENHHLTMILISHEIPVVRFISDFIAVMVNGYIIERAPADRWFCDPAHPYSQLWLESEKPPKQNVNPNLTIKASTDYQKGCVFYKRCPIQMNICAEQMPDEKPVTHDHFVRCHAFS